MQSTATLRHLRIAPRKVRLLVDLIRGEKVAKALVQLSLSKKHAAVSVKKLIESSIANAVHNHHLDPQSLVIHNAFVNEGKTLYRWMPRAMGRATPLRKRTSHLTIVLEGDVHEHAHEHKKEELAEEKEVVAEKKEKKVTKKAATAPRKTSRKQ